MYDGHYGYDDWSSQTGTIGRYKHAVRDNWSTRAGMARATEFNRYIRAAGNAMSIGTTRVAGSAGWGSFACAVGQRVLSQPFTMAETLDLIRPESPKAHITFQAGVT